MKDHAQFHRHQKPSLSWIWFFPILALLTTLWFLWQKWSAYGPEVVVQFEEAPGIESNKTLLFYRGVVSGNVTDVRLDPQLGKALVTIRLRNFAAPLAQEGTLYWIDQPVISLAKTSGLSSLIQGNSIQARLGPGPKKHDFIGLEHMPLHPLAAPGLLLKLQADNLPNLEEGSPVFYRGIAIGGVQEKGVDSQGTPYALAAIEKKYSSLIHDKTVFWMPASSSCHLGPQGLTIKLESLQQMLMGSINVDNFVASKTLAANGATFRLYPSKEAIPAYQGEFQFYLHAADIPNIMVGSPLLYHGVPVGEVVDKSLDKDHQARLSLLVKGEYQDLLKVGSRFWRVPATMIQAGPGVLQVHIASLSALLQGAIAFDQGDFAGGYLPEGSTRELFSNRKMAELDPTPLLMRFDDGQGLLAGETEIRYLGIPIGVVGDIKVCRHYVEVRGYLKPGYQFLRNQKQGFTVVHSKLGFDGLSGLETLLSGVYIECDTRPQPRKPVHQIFQDLFTPSRLKKGKI